MHKCIEFIYKHKYKILLIILYILFFIQMQNVFLFDDDFDVTYPIYLDQSLSLKLNFIAKKMKFFWFDWSGRIMGHLVVTSGLSLFGIKFFTFLNPIIIFLISFVCSKILGLIRKIDFDKILFFISLLIISMNVIIARETLYWAYGGILYIWGFLLGLIVFYYVFKYDLQESKFSLKIFTLLIFLIIIQAFFLEQLALIVIGFLFVFFINSLIHKKINYQYLMLFGISIISFCVSVSAPGNFDRVDVLVTNYTLFDKFVSKLLTFYQLVLDKNFCGLYVIFFSFLLIFNVISKKIDIKYYLPIGILIVGNLIFLLSDYIDIFPFLKLHINYNSFDLIDYKYLYNYSMVIFWLIFCTLYIFSFIFLIFKNFDNKKKFLSFLLFFSLISIIVPVVCLQYIGARYCLPFIIVIIMFIIDSILNCEKRVFISSAFIFLYFLIPSQYLNIYVVISLILIMILLLKFGYIVKTYNVLIFIMTIWVIFNFFITYKNYTYNKKINDYNEKVILNSNNNKIFLKEIPYNLEKYTWHTFFSDYTSYNIYYTYLNDYVSNYYGIDARKIVVIDSDVKR